MSYIVEGRTISPVASLVFAYSLGAQPPRAQYTSEPNEGVVPDIEAFIIYPSTPSLYATWILLPPAVMVGTSSIAADLNTTGDPQVIVPSDHVPHTQVP